MNYAILAAIAVGVSLGTGGAYAVARSFTLRLAKRSNHRLLVITLASIAGIATIPFAFFASFVIGGNVGGGWGGYLLSMVGAEALGVPLGLALGIALVLCVGIAFGASIGALAGYGASQMLPRSMKL